MCCWPKEDPKYDPNKSRAENYQILRKLMENRIEEIIKTVANCDEVKVFMKERWYKGAHLDWNYTEMLRDLIDQGLVEVPITDFDVVFVEWASGNLDNVENTFYKGDKALYDWDGGNKEDHHKRALHGEAVSLWWEIKYDFEETHFYNDSNQEEFTPTPAETTPVVSTVSSSATVEQIPQQIEYGNHDEPNFIPWQKRKHTAFWVTGVAE